MSTQSGFCQRLRAGQPLLGAVITVPDVGLAELTAGPVDFVWVDLEHGALGQADVQPLAIAARAGGAAALARLPSLDGAASSAILDAGVDGVVAPRLESADEAARLVDSLRLPPRGSRGSAARRAVRYGRNAELTDLACMVQIESPAGVAHSEEIAAVDGVDALVVGCADLSLMLGADVDSPAFADAVAQVQSAAARAGIASGIAGPEDPALLATLAQGRSSVLVLSADVRIYARAFDAAVAALDREPRPRVPDGEGSRVGA